MTAFDQIYQGLLTQIRDTGIEELSTRTGLKTKALPGLHFRTDLERDGFPLLTLRKIPIRIFVAEQIWFLLGSRKPEEFLRQYTKIWDVFTNPGDVVTVAYGYRWRKHFGRDQIALLIDLLRDEPSSRHGVVMAWDPGADGLSLFKKKNVPCPYTFTVNIIGGRLPLHNIVRSNDMMLGCPHDVAGFALLQMILAEHLGVRPGVYAHSISNAHIYENHYAGAEALIGRSNDHQPIKLALPEHCFERIEHHELGVAEEIIDLLSSQYQPLPPINGLKIAL